MPRARNQLRDPSNQELKSAIRIKELRRVRASELRPHPQNWRNHGKAQREALRAVLLSVQMG
jgi:hypothetical protein